VTHLFHPLAGRAYALAQRKRTWGDDRVFLFDEEGQLFSLPASWTDVDPVDPFSAISAGRSSLRFADLLELAALIERVAPRKGRRPVKATTPRL
jgi:hypothetical protein